MYAKIKVAFCVLLLLVASVAYGYVQSFKLQVPRLNMTRLEDALASLKTGDLIFTRSQNWSSKLQMYFCQTYINHCCMVYKAHDGNLWVFDVSPREGAYMSPLVDFIRYNWKGLPPRPSEAPPIGLNIPYMTPRQTELLMSKSAVYIRRLQKPLDERLALRFLQENIGRPYSYRWWLSAFFESPFAIHLPIPWSFAQDNPGMFCSEIIAHLFAQQGYIDTRKSAPESILPSTFWTSSVAWIKGQALQDAEQIIGNEAFIPIFKQDDRISKNLEWLEGARQTDKLGEGLVNALLWSEE